MYDLEVTLAAVLLASGPVRVQPADAIKAGSATLIMEHEPATDSWLLRAVPADQDAPAESVDSVRVPAG
jgi:hypothetical protein